MLPAPIGGYPAGAAAPAAAGQRQRREQQVNEPETALPQPHRRAYQASG